MSCAVERCRAGAKDAAGDRRYPPAPVREAELPLHKDGEVLHERVVLSYFEASRTRFVTLPKEVVEPVRLATEQARYRRARTRLETEGNSGLKALMSSLRSRP